MHEHHLLQLLSGVIQWIDPPEAVSRAIENGKSERLGHIKQPYSSVSNFNLFGSLTLVFVSSEMLDGCRALLSVATITNPLVFDKLLKSSRLVAV